MTKLTTVTRVLYFSRAHDGSSFYRMQGVMPYISGDGLSMVDISDLSKITWGTLSAGHVLAISRPTSSEDYSIIWHAKKLGLKVIVDWDDNPFLVPDHNPAHGYIQDNINSVRNCIDLADKVWVSTPGIAKSIKHHDIAIIPNAHNDHIFPVEWRRPFDPMRKKAVYRGGKTHLLDLFWKMTDLAMLMNEYKDWTFMFVGTRSPELESQTGHNHHYTNELPTMEYHDFLHSYNAQVMLCPLTDTPFNYCKSNIAWLEATYSGSVLFGNRNLPEFEKPGVQAFGDLLNSPQKYLSKEGRLNLHAAAEKSWKYVQENLLLSKINELRKQSILK